ncbi:hypothetical protein DOTSEDRAFT_99868, partial [Dothistroma septosporum NZE10]
MTLNIRPTTGRTIRLEAESDTTIDTIKIRHEDLTGISAVDRRLLFGGKQLEDDLIFSE